MFARECCQLIILLREVLQTTTRWQRWQDVADACRHDANLVVSHLIQERNYELARRLTHLHNVPHLKREIEENYMLDLLNANDIGRAQRVLSSMGEEAVSMCDFLLEKLQSYGLKLVVLQYGSPLDRNGD